MSQKPDAIVYVVDDDAAILKSLGLLLRSEGYTVRTCASAQEFLSAYDPEHPGCVVLDVRMPGMGGLELQSELEARGISVPVIIMTGHGDVPMAVRAMRAGARDFIEKPFTNERLLERVREALQASASRFDELSRHAQVRGRLDQLSRREQEVLDHLVSGKLNKQIAAELGISVRTVEAHRARIMDKLEVRTLSGLVRLSLAANRSSGRG